MSALRNRILAGLLIGTAAIVGGSVPARAEEKPAHPEDAEEQLSGISLPDAPKSAPAATPVAPAATPAEVPTATAVAMPGKVDVGMLGSPEGDSVGLLDGSGGLGSDLWSGSSRGTVVELVSHAPLSSADSPLRDLSRRVVLTKAAAPSGQAKRAVTTVRIEKLLEAGLIEEAGALAAQTSLSNDADFSRVQANALLYAGRTMDICTDRTATRLASGEKFWVELRAYCAAVAGDSALADLTRAVLDAQGGDKAFDVLLGDVQNKKNVAPGVIAAPNALHVFLLRRLSLPVSGMVAEKGGTPENLFAMRDRRNAPEVRLAAAERLVRTGAGLLSDYRAVADVQTITIELVAKAESVSADMPFFAAQVLLRRAAHLETKPERKARLIQLALERGEKERLFRFSANLQGDVLALLLPQSGPTAPLFVRALVLVGNTKVAARWPTTGTLTTALLLFSTEPQADAKLQAALGKYAASLADKTDKPDPNRDAKAMVLEMADVLGRLGPETPKTAAAALGKVWAGKRPDAAMQREIETAAATPGRKGEALLLAMEQIRSIGWRDMAPDAAAKLVRLFSALGAKDIARACAVEALMSYVVPPQ
jgi:hypothetical protein